MPRLKMTAQITTKTCNGRSVRTTSSGAEPWPWSTSSAYRSTPITNGTIESWYHGTVRWASSAFSNAHTEYDTNTVAEDRVSTYVRNESEYSPSVDRTAEASSPISVRSARRLP